MLIYLPIGANILPRGNSCHFPENVFPSLLARTSKSLLKKYFGEMFVTTFRVKEA